MENIPINSIDEVDDISSRDEYEVALRAGKTPEEAIRIVSEFSRDNARTPYQWNSTENAGFTSGKPWLRVNPNYREINFENEEKDPDSVLSYYKKLLALRKNPNDRDTLIFGSLKPVWEDRPGIMAYERSSENQKILIAANFSREPQAIKPGSGYSKVLLNNLPELSENEGTITLGAYQAVILEI